MKKRGIKLLTYPQLKRKNLLISIIRTISCLIAGMGIGMYIVMICTWGKFPQWVTIMTIAIIIFNWIAGPIIIVVQIRFNKQLQAFNLIQAYKGYEF